ncbi:MAG: polysaccharide biosynthesis protein [Candidatus Binatia bacterium]
MGTSFASKRLDELLLQSQNRQQETRFACVRFGNVMDSRGSVIPLFQNQIATGGPITLTDPEVKRYFMTIPEAVQLVIQAGLLNGENGSIYVLDMGNPVRIADMARDLVELAGLRVGQDIQIKTIGLRPGEKMSEELVGEGEAIVPTEHPRIFLVNNTVRPQPEEMERLLARLWEASQSDEPKEIYAVLEDFKVLIRREGKPSRLSAPALVASKVKRAPR